MCVSAGEGARNQKESAARQCGHILHKTSHLPHPTKGVLIFSEQLGRLAPLKAKVCVCLHWEAGVVLHRQAIFTRVPTSEWTVSVNESNRMVGFYMQWIAETQQCFSRQGWTPLWEVNTIWQDKERWYSRHIKNLGQQRRMLWCAELLVLWLSAVYTASIASQFTIVQILDIEASFGRMFRNVSGWSSGSFWFDLTFSFFFSGGFERVSPVRNLGQTPRVLVSQLPQLSHWSKPLFNRL